MDRYAYSPSFSIIEGTLTSLNNSCYDFAPEIMSNDKIIYQDGEYIFTLRRENYLINWHTKSESINELINNKRLMILIHGDTISLCEETEELYEYVNVGNYSSKYPPGCPPTKRRR
jgi:hypothetical protein